MTTSRSGRAIAAAAGLATVIAITSPNTTSDISSLLGNAKNSVITSSNNLINPTGYAENEKVTLLNTGNRLYAEFRGSVFEFHSVRAVDNDGALDLVYTANKISKGGPIKGDMANRAKDFRHCFIRSIPIHRCRRSRATRNHSCH